MLSIKVFYDELGQFLTKMTLANILELLNIENSSTSDPPLPPPPNLEDC